MLMSGVAQVVTSIDELDNSKAYTISRNALSGKAGSIHNGGTGAVRVGSTRGVTGDDLLWAIHYSEVEKSYFLYNLGAGKFVQNVDNVATFSDAPADVTPIFMDNIRMWAIDCGGSLLGLETEDNYGKVIFTDDYTKANVRNEGLAYNISISPSRTISKEENDAIEAKIQAGRAEVFAGYQEFIDAAKEHAADGLSNYAGAYDVSQLEYALAHPYKFSLLEVNKIYRDALLSRLPKSGKYYVLRNAQRPSTNFKNNMLSLTGQDNFKSRSLSTPRVGNGTSDYPESLNLFNVESSGADPYSVKLRCAATGTYIVSNFNNNAKVYLGEKSKATVFTLQPVGEFDRTFAFAIEGKDDMWLTISGGDHTLVNYGTAEPAEHFYLEEIKTLTVSFDRYGYTDVMLPCPVEIPADVEVLIPVEEYEGKVYIEKHPGNVLPANVPAIMRKTGAGKSAVLTIADENPAFTNDNLLVGTNVRRADPPARHELSANAEGFTFAPSSSRTALAPNSAYLLSENNIELVTTFEKRPYAHIVEIPVSEIDADAKWYDLQGRRVMRPQPGNLYINGSTKSLMLIR